MEEVFIDKLKQVKTDVDNAKYQLKLALNILSEDITISGKTFQEDNIDDALSMMNSIINGVENEITSIKNNKDSSEENSSEEDTGNDNQNDSTPTKPPINKKDSGMRLMD